MLPPIHRGLASNKALLALASLVAFLFIATFWTHRPAFTSSTNGRGYSPSGFTPKAKSKTAQPNRVFATLLMGPSVEHGNSNPTNENPNSNSTEDQQQEQEEDWSEDHYFTGTRLLAYQLLHHPSTRSGHSFVVFVSNRTSHAKRRRLVRDGARVIEIAPIPPPAWFDTGALNPNYVDVLAKLHLWEFEEFDRICLLDGDIVLSRSLEGIFDDPAVAERKTGSDHTAKAYDAAEGALPETYAFAAVRETAPGHAWPPSTANGTKDYRALDNLNAGVMILKPSRQLFKHYMAILNLGPGRFNTNLPEQNLLNYAHRLGGNMAWQPLGVEWNVNFPTMEDVKGGVRSVHEKFWGTGGELGEWLKAWRWRMEGFYEGWDQAEGS